MTNPYRPPQQGETELEATPDPQSVAPDLKQRARWFLFIGITTGILGAAMGFVVFGAISLLFLSLAMATLWGARRRFESTE